MDGNRLDALQQRAAELERELAQLDGAAAPEWLHAALAEVKMIAAELRRGDAGMTDQPVSAQSQPSDASSTDRFRHAFAQAPIPLLLIDREGRGFEMNRALSELCARGGEMPEAVVQNIVARAVAGTLTMPHETALTASDGSTRILSWTAFPSDNGAAERFVCVAAVDVTARARAERALHESEQRFEVAFRHAPIGMSLATISGRPLQANPALCAFLGYSEEELLARTAYDITYLDDLANGETLIRRLLAGEIPSFSYEKRYVHKQGHLVWGLLNVAVQRDGTGVPRYIVAQVLDMTERRKAEEAWRESEKRLAIAFEHAPIGMVLMRVPFGLEVNNAFRTMLGYSDQELMDLGLPGIVHPDDLEAALASLDAFLNGKQEGYQVERRFVHRGGRTVSTLLSVSAVRDADGAALFLIGQVQDITERKRAAEALQASEERFRALVENAFDAIFLVGASGELIYASPSTTKIFGYRPEELLGSSVQPFVHPDDLQSVNDFLRASVTAPGASAVAEIRIRHRHGHWVWTEGVAQNLLHNPHIGAFVINARDISERKEAQYALVARDARFQAIMEHSSDIVSLMDAQGTMEYVGPSVYRLLGIRSEAFLGHDGADRVHPDDVASNANAFKRVVNTPRSEVIHTYRFQHQDGSWLWLESILTNLLDEPSVGAIVSHTRDVTERKVAELLLRESEERFAIAVAGANEGLWDWNLPANEYYCSPRMREILGLPLEGPVMPPQEMGLRIHPDDLERVTTQFMNHFNGTEPRYEAEYRFQRPDGEYRWILARGLCVRDANGHAHRLVGSVTDVTTRIQAEEEARQRQAELAHVLRVSTMGEMASGLAHEVNQPLAAIVNYARGCIHRLDSVLPADKVDEVVGVLERIATEALRAGSIVHGLRQFLRKEPPQHARADLNQLVTAAVRLIEADARHHGVPIRVTLGEGMPPVRVDHVQIEQVIVNLVRNGLEAMQRGNGSRRELTIQTAIGEDAALAVTVRDAGEGLSEAIAERIFDPFFTTKPNGLGMGLSISRSIIEAHGGRIWFASNPHGGATFAFTLPIADAGTIDT